MVYPPYDREYTSDPWELRRIFNEKYLPKIQNNELTKKVRRQNHLNKNDLKNGIPYCTHSQTVNYINQHGKVVAMAHQYLLPNNTIGASGKPDPKLVVTENNKILCYDPQCS